MEEGIGIIRRGKWIRDETHYLRRGKWIGDERFVSGRVSVCL